MENWKIKAGSIMGIAEDKGVTKKAKDIRQKAKIDKNGKLLEDTLTLEFAHQAMLGWLF